MELADRVIHGGAISGEDAMSIAGIEGTEVFELFTSANKIREAFRKDKVDLCSIINAKSGACPENCSYCAQSSKAKTQVDVYPLVSKDLIIDRAKEARDMGVRRFCIVTSGKRASRAELREIAGMITGVRKLGLLPCATLGLIGEKDLRMLKSAGLERYHHNIETSRRFFPEICSTHTYEEKLSTMMAVKTVGLSLCSGGIFGMGEDQQDRVEMALTLRASGADSVPINFLIPIKGTRLEAIEPIRPIEALKVVSLFRFLLPEKEIRLCGGRLQTLGELNSLVFLAGADGLLVGNYLTTTGRGVEDDLRLISEFGLRKA